MIPVRCFTCGNVLADKHRYFKFMVAKMYAARGIEKEEYYNVSSGKTPEGEMMDILRLNKPCCRRHMLTVPDSE